LHPSEKHATDSEEELLNRGFVLLKDDLTREFQMQIGELNHEPGCNNILGWTFSNRDSRVFRSGDGEEKQELTIDFNSEERTAEIKGKEPIRFYYFIRVRLVKDKTAWCYAGGEDKDNLSTVTGKLDMVVEKALMALFGVEA